MLRELHIENLAVIENATVSLGSGLNIFTGETGAGKSILIGGINAVLGQRIFRDTVRAGAEKAYIEAVFDDLPPSVRLSLEELGITPEDELIISREISADGRGTARINSRAVSVSALKDIGERLVNIHGQHDSQVLLDPSKHLGILDSFGDTLPVLEDYRTTFRELQAAARKIKELKLKSAETARREAYLRSLVDDIKPLGLTPDEEEQVEERFKILDNSLELARSINSAVLLLTGDDDTDGAAGEVLSALNELNAAGDILSSLKPLNERLQSLSIELSDVSEELTRLGETLDIDPAEYECLSGRRDDILSLKRRYGGSLRDIIELCQKSEAELSQLYGGEAELERLESEKDALLAAVSKKAENLHALRKAAAERFKEQVETELKFLNMPEVRLEVKLEKGKLTGTGMDSAEFLISSNRGEEPKPVAKIASGGELSRIMLALKTVLADRDDIPTLIFDEIDAGVSGRAAQKIGVKLKELSRHRQVICVTHLAQIAINGDEHILIEKSEVGSRTVTDIKKLNFEGRKLEIARILGGDRITDTVLKDAEEQLLTALGKE